jgi:hypothetical protein
MRKKTNPSAQTTPKSSRTQPSSGLIAADKKRQQSAGAECVLDNRSHRTFQHCRRLRSGAEQVSRRARRAKRGATAMRCYALSEPLADPRVTFPQ